MQQRDRMYHIGLYEEQLEGAQYVILPGDPGRVPKIAAMLQKPQALNQNREYTSWLGWLAGQPVVVCSTGIGGPSAAICVEELYQLGVRNFLRVGTCGGMQVEVQAGDIVIATGAIRMEGTSREYLPIEFPAVADFGLCNALCEAARKEGCRCHTGVVQCKDSFYGQHSPARMPVREELEQKWEAWKRGGCLASEMESAALYTVCASLGARAAAVLLTVWNQEREAAGLDQQETHDTQRAIRVAVEALRGQIEKQTV